MRRLLLLLLATAIIPSNLRAQAAADAPADTSMYAVSYVDVMPSARKAVVTALTQYREASRKDAGFRRFDFFEQIGWPGHVAVVERWADQKAFDAHGTAAHTTTLLGSLQPLRTSGYDQRVYKTFTVGSAPSAASAQAVHVMAHVDTANPPTEAIALIRRLMDASRKEAGNVRFDVMQQTTRANHFTVIETWQSQSALDAHEASAHRKEYREKIQPMTGSPLDERVYKAIE